MTLSDFVILIFDSPIHNHKKMAGASMDAYIAHNHKKMAGASMDAYIAAAAQTGKYKTLKACTKAAENEIKRIKDVKKAKSKLSSVEKTLKNGAGPARQRQKLLDKRKQLLKKLRRLD